MDLDSTLVPARREEFPRFAQHFLAEAHSRLSAVTLSKRGVDAQSAPDSAHLLVDNAIENDDGPVATKPPGRYAAGSPIGLAAARRGRHASERLRRSRRSQWTNRAEDTP